MKQPFKSVVAGLAALVLGACGKVNEPARETITVETSKAGITFRVENYKNQPGVEVRFVDYGFDGLLDIVWQSKPGDDGWTPTQREYGVNDLGESYGSESEKFRALENEFRRVREAYMQKQ